MTVSVQSAEERRLAQARRLSLERELARWRPLLIAHDRPKKFVSLAPTARERSKNGPILIS